MEGRPTRIPGGRPDRTPIPTKSDTGFQSQREKRDENKTVNVQELDRDGKTKLKIEIKDEDKENYAWLNTEELEVYLDSMITKFFAPKVDTKFRGKFSTESQYLANCRKATRDFGSLLNTEPIDDKQTNFFDKYKRKNPRQGSSPENFESTEYYDFQKNIPSNVLTQENFHSIGFISIPNPNDPNKGYYIALDLTHYATADNRNARVLAIHGTGRNAVQNKLNEIYQGADWEIFKFDRDYVSKSGQKGTFVAEV